MRTTILRAAQSVSSRPLRLREVGASLLPPIPLYRGILRSHRHLPSQMRQLGDEYIKAEFRRHRAITNPIHIIGFLSEWKKYLDGLPKGTEEGLEWSGRKLDPGLIEKMSEEQLGQLYELMHATKDVWKSQTKLEEEANAVDPLSDQTIASDSTKSKQ